MTSFPAEKASRELLSRAVTQTVAPLSVRTARAGLHPALTVDFTDLPGCVSAVCQLMTLSVPTDGRSPVSLRWKLVT